MFARPHVAETARLPFQGGRGRSAAPAPAARDDGPAAHAGGGAHAAHYLAAILVHAPSRVCQADTRPHQGSAVRPTIVALLNFSWFLTVRDAEL